MPGTRRGRVVGLLIVALVPACTGGGSSAPSTSDTMGPTSTDTVPTSATTAVATMTTQAPVEPVPGGRREDTADQSAGELVVPGLAAPTIDGVVDPEEWAGAARTTADDGSDLLWLHADDILYVAVVGGEVGSVNLALAEGERVRILHSSAALGSATYQMVGGEWRLTDGFEWCCRSRIDESEAQALVASEGWLANIGYVGTPGHVEFRVAWPDGDLRVALSLVPASGPAAFWPVGLPAEVQEALYGDREDVETFGIERWVPVIRDASA